MSHRTCNTVEAKAKLNELLDDVSEGREVVIRRRGKAIAKLVAASEETLDDHDQTKRFMKHLKEFHRRVRQYHGPKSQTVHLLRELRRES